MGNIIDLIDLGGIGHILGGLLIFILLICILSFIVWTILPFSIFGIKRLIKEIILEQREIKKCLKSIEKIERKIDLLITSESQTKHDKEGRKDSNHFGSEED